MWPIILGLSLGPLCLLATYVFLKNAFTNFPPPNSATNVQALASIGLALSTTSFEVATAMIAASLASIALLCALPTGLSLMQRIETRSFRWRLGSALLPMFIAGASMSTALATEFYDAPISENPALYSSTWSLLAADWGLMTLLLWQILSVSLLTYVVYTGIRSNAKAVARDSG